MPEPVPSGEPTEISTAPHATSVAWAIAPGVTLAGVAGGIAFPILPIVGLRAGLPLAFIGVILAANRAGRIVSNPIVGMATDRFGGKRTLLGGLLMQIIVMFLYILGVKTSHPGLYFLLGRILHGPGSSCVFVAGQALALNAAGGRRSGQSAGIVRGTMAIGVPIGLVLGGVLADAFGETVTFAVAGGAVFLATLGAYFLVPDLRVNVAKRASFFVSLRGLGNKRLAAIGGLNFAATFAGSGMVLTTATLLVAARHLSILGYPERASASILMGLLVVSEASSTSLWGRLGDRRKAHALIAAFGVASMIPSLIVIANAHTAFIYGLGLAMLGLGVGALGPSVLALVGELVAPAIRGLAVGVLQVCSDIGGALGPLVGTALFTGSLTLPYYVSAIVVALFVPAAIWLVVVRTREPVASPHGQATA